MKLFEGRPGAGQLIRRYDATAITLGTQSHALPLLLANDGTCESLGSISLASLNAEDFARVVAKRPVIVLAGSAHASGPPPAALRAAFEERRIALEWMDLGAACRTFNVLLQEDREVLALLFS